MPKIKDFTQSNRWKRLEKKMVSPTEKELLCHIELLERQIITLEEIVNALSRDMEDDAK